MLDAKILAPRKIQYQLNIWMEWQEPKANPLQIEFEAISDSEARNIVERILIGFDWVIWRLFVLGVVFSVAQEYRPRAAVR